MAFVKKTWKDRDSEYPNRRIIDEGNVQKLVTVSRDEGEVYEEGDAFNAANMNDLENRIAAIGSGGGASAISELSDVNISYLENGEILKYNSTSGKWENAAESGGGGTSLNTVTVGTDSSCDYVCDGVADNIQFQQAINTISSRGGGTVLVKGGEYTFNACVNVLSHVHLEMQKDTVITLDDQQIWTLPSTTTAGATTITVSDDILDYVILGQEVGFTNGETGYLIEGEDAHRDFITSIDTVNKTVTLHYGCPENMTFTTLCTLTSGFSMLHFIQGDSTDISIRNGVINGNIDNTTVWINDMCQNGIIADLKNIVIDGIEIYGFKFQGIHITANAPLVSTTRKIDEVDNYAIVKNCYVHDTGFAGICIDSSIWVKVIDCNVASVSGQGIQLVECCYVDVINCVSTKNTYAGIRAVKSYGIGYNYNFIGNKTSDNAVGFGFASISSSIMTNCISEDDTVGIYFEGTTNKCVVSNVTVIGATTGIKEDDTASNNIGSGLNLVNNTTNLDIGTMSIVDSRSDVTLEKQSNTLIYINDMNDVILGGLTPNTNLVDDSADVFDLSLFQDWVVHEGYGYAGEFILEPNTAYTIWTNAPSDTNTLYFGTLDISVESSGGTRTVTTDSTGHIWAWIISGRAGTELYRNGTYKVTLVEGTEPFKFNGRNKYGGSWIDLTDTLEAGETTLTFSDSAITTNSTIDYYTDVFGVNPTNVVVSAGQVVLTFEEQENNLGVKVRIS